jgi:dTDP-4-amino-4,6-dideoxygalactose transaminase
MRWLCEFTERRRAIARRYQESIRAPKITLLAPPQQPGAHVHHLYVVLCEQREALQHHLAAAGIQSLIHYPVPVHRQAPCTGLARDPEGLENTEAHAARCLSLPCHPQMTDEDVARVVDVVNSFR